MAVESSCELVSPLKVDELLLPLQDAMVVTENAVLSIADGQPECLRTLNTSAYTQSRVEGILVPSW